MLVGLRLIDGKWNGTRGALALLLALGLTAGCASSGGGSEPPPSSGGSGGGGGGNTTLPPSEPEPEPDPEPEPIFSPSGYRLDEAGIKNPWTRDLGTSWASSKPAELVGLVDSNGDRLVANRGAGVTIAVYDADFNPNHDQLAHRSETATLDYYETRDLHEDYLDEGVKAAAYNHGTHVATIAAGRYGVAPDANLQLYRGSFDGMGRVWSPQSHDLFGTLIDRGVQIVNLSIDGVDPSMGPTDEVGLIKEAGLILVMAGGANRNPDPISGATATAMMVDPDWEQAGGLGVIVGMLGNDGLIAFSSNHAGVTTFEDGRPGSRQYFITAPGVSIHAGVTNDDASDNESLAPMTGTSMSTPMVTGTLALILSEWPHLRGEEAVAVLFESADRDFDEFRQSVEEGQAACDARDDQWTSECQTKVDRYDYALSPVYGHGRLDIAAALSPLGEPQIASTQSVADGGANLRDSRLNLGAAFGDALSQSSVLSEAVVFDKYGRDFRADLAMLVGSQSGKDYGAALGALASHTWVETMEDRFGGQSMTLSMRGNSNIFGFTGAERPDVERLSLDMQLAGGHRLGLHQASTDLGLPWGSQALPRDLPLLHNLGSDGYLGGWSQANAIEWVSPLAGGFNLQVSAVRASDDLFGDLALGQSGAADAASRYQFGVFGRVTANTLVHLESSVIRQDDRLFNTRGQGAFALGDGVSTQTVALGLRHQRGNVGLFAWHEQGMTDVGTDQLSIMRDFSVLHTAQSVAGADLRFGSVRTGAVYSEPLRVHRGSVTLDVPVGRTLDGQVVREQVRADLTPSGHERRVELFMEAPVASFGPVQQGYVRLNAAVRHEPGNVKGAGTEGFAGLVFEGRL